MKAVTGRFILPNILLQIDNHAAFLSPDSKRNLWQIEFIDQGKRCELPLYMPLPALIREIEGRLT